MKKFFLSAAVALMALAANAQTNVEFGSVRVEDGQAIATLNLSTLDTDASGIQLDIKGETANVVSEGTGDDLFYYIDPVGCLATKKGKNAAWNVESAAQKDGSIRVLVYGTAYGTFITNYSGTDKGIIEVTFDKAEGDVKVYNVEVANGKGEKLQSVKEFSFNLGGATGISSVAVNEISGAAYNVAGQKVAANAKGLVIMNGKKFINK